MQVFIAKTLNKLLVLFLGVILFLFGGIFLAARFYPEYLRVQTLMFITVSVFLAIWYRWLEERWDKGIIQKMAQSGKVALCAIRGGKRLLVLRDTAFRSYWIYEITGELYDASHKKREIRFQEKMNRETGEIPEGSVYVTWDEAKPSQVFIIPNLLIGALPQLRETVEAYERDPAIEVKYLDARYRRGMELKTFRETLEDYKKAAPKPPHKEGNV
ncbi:MAG: hypothetical protein LBD09_06075 [Treponema sp.]|nr:hypothetical protein [Treponema sp.]